MTRFANAYWSPDYRSGIDKLLEQLLSSLGQLHELRKFVFSYMNYYHSNGEFLAKLAVDSTPMDSQFRRLGQRRLVSATRKIASKQEPELGMDHFFQQFVERTTFDLRGQLELASTIDKKVLESLTAFIKHHEPQIKATMEHLEELFNEYEASYVNMETLKHKYQSFVRLGEFSSEDHRAEPEEPEESEPNIVSTPPRPTVQSVTSPSATRALEIDFPLAIGGVLRFNTSSEFAGFLASMIASISTIKRKINFPGYRNEIFSSDQLCEWLVKNRNYGFNPTRLNLERLGQGLIDMKLLIGTGVFGKKFKSEGMWFEWSEQAIQYSQGEEATLEVMSLPSQALASMKLDETSKYLNDVAQSTSKTFNGMFKSMRSSLMKPKFLEDGIKELESKYNEAYEELQRLKHLLDLEIFDKSQVLEKFEKLRIDIIYRSLATLLEIIYNSSLQSTTTLREFASKTIEDLNKPEYHANDFQRMLERFSTGIYFPSIVSPDVLSNRHLDTSQLNTNFQNIKVSFNLYKDIPLQVKMSTLTPLLSLQSIPQILFKLISILSSAEQGELLKLWLDPVKHQEYWLVKYEIINAVQEYTPEAGVNIHDEIAVEGAIINSIVEILKGKDPLRIVNFLKNWLLETSDAIIPCMVFDSLVGNYRRSGLDIEQQQAETIRILSTIPRSNLSSLVYILEHISSVFELGKLDGFGSSDEINAENGKSEEIEQAVAKLNSMEAIATVPFLHLILRPSVVKNASGFKPPIEEYNRALQDLLNPQVRFKLFTSLVANEKNYIQRQELQKKSFAIPKPVERPAEVVVTETTDAISPGVEVTPTTPTKAVITSAPLKSPQPMSDNFALRPFRTGVTPRPTPTSSPSHSKKRSVDLQTMTKSGSTNFLAPTLDIEFGE